MLQDQIGEQLSKSGGIFVSVPPLHTCRSVDGTLEFRLPQILILS